ncbi:MAG: hypothetical protein P8H99_07320 [Luminiphilus sp.]|nr:hypothetical protein [Luminiphilus sp.]
MKLFGLFGKSSNDDKDTATEESATPVSSEEHIAPPEEPSSQSQEAVDRGGTMSEVIKAVTDQFALINADSDADLRAVGAALCQIPEGMAPLSEGFASFRHEVLHAILMTGDEAGMADRAVVLNNCLAAIEDTPDLAEQSISLRIIAEELRDTMLSAHREAPGQGIIAEPAAALSADEVTPERNEPSNQEGISTTEPDPAGAPFVAASFEAPSTVTLEEEQQEGLEPSAADAPAFEVIEGARAAKAPLEAVSPASFAAEASDEAALSQEASPQDDEASTASITPKQQLVGTIAHADQLIGSVTVARQGVQDERASNPSEHFGEYGDDMSEFVGALGNVTSSCLQALDTCFGRELETLKHYRDVCAELELGATRLADSRRCITFIDAGLRGEPCDDDLSGTENQWLGSLTTQLANVSAEQSTIALEKGEQIKDQIAEIQLEADQASELIKKLGSETLEPPATVLQSLTSNDFASEESDAELDYEDSIDQYIEWMKKQREAIRDQRRRIEELDQKMAEAERAADRQYSGKLEPIQRRKEELTRNLEDALLSASKDAEETETRLNALTQDASTLITEYEMAVDKRASFAANVEDAMASAMIRLGNVLDEANMASSAEGSVSS